MFEIEKVNKIFCIGFNKTATTAIHKFFERNNLKSFHNSKWSDVNLNKYRCFSDNGDLHDFEELDKKYPDSLFILNTRSFDKWILSRLKHGYHMSKRRKEDKNWAYPVTEELINSWVSKRISHYNKILNYFNDKTDKLIILDIEKKDWSNFLCSVINLENNNNSIVNKLNASEKYTDLCKAKIEKYFKDNNLFENKSTKLIFDKETNEKFIKNFKNNL